MFVTSRIAVSSCLSQRRLSWSGQARLLLIFLVALFLSLSFWSTVNAQYAADGRADWRSDQLKGLSPRPADDGNVAKEPSDPSAALPDGFSSLNGSGNNIEQPEQGAAGTVYRRMASANYGDGIGALADGPEPRYVSNRIFEDNAQNLFSENGVTQWAYNWGQFIDHSIGLRESGEEQLDIAFDVDDPLEYFTNEANVLLIQRSGIADGSGVDSPREQINLVSSYIDAAAVYGNDEARLEWLREGPVDGDLSNNSARLLLTDDGLLPRAIERGEPDQAPTMELQGQLLFAPDVSERMIIAGDRRANENIALTAVQTLLAREHNRIVDQLPARWPEQRKFDTARQLIIAIQQYITYEEFLPAVGVQLSPAKGYQADVDASVSNEFATVGYRAHSMIHGEIEVATEASRYDAETLAGFRSLGIELEIEGDELEMAVPLNVAFNRPQLVPAIELGPLLMSLGGEPQYKNDEQFDNQLRSVLFQLPREGLQDPDACLDGPTMRECFSLVSDLGVLDIVRGRDHGMPLYNDMRAAYGLPRIESFTELTGESTDRFPTDDPMIDEPNPVDDPDTLRFVSLSDADGLPIELESEKADGDAVSGVRASTLAARLKGIYGDVDNVDAFVGMVSEPHLPGSEFGELQHAMWARQFEDLRDGDRFFYAWNPALDDYREPQGQGGLTYRRTLSDLIMDNTELSSNKVRPDLFRVARD